MGSVGWQPQHTHVMELVRDRVRVRVRVRDRDRDRDHLNQRRVNPLAHTCGHFATTMCPQPMRCGPGRVALGTSLMVGIFGFARRGSLSSPVLKLPR